MTRNENVPLRDQQPGDQSEIAITVIATVIILLTFLFIAVLT